MKKYKVRIKIHYFCKKSETVKKVICAADADEARKVAFKVFVNDEIEAETGLLDDVFSIRILEERKVIFCEEIVTD